MMRNEVPGRPYPGRAFRRPRRPQSSEARAVPWAAVRGLDRAYKQLCSEARRAAFEKEKCCLRLSPELRLQESFGALWKFR